VRYRRVDARSGGLLRALYAPQVRRQRGTSAGNVVITMRNAPKDSHRTSASGGDRNYNHPDCGESAHAHIVGAWQA